MDTGEKLLKGIEVLLSSCREVVNLVKEQSIQQSQMQAKAIPNGLDGNPDLKKQLSKTLKMLEDSEPFLDSKVRKDFIKAAWMIECRYSLKTKEAAMYFANELYHEWNVCNNENLMRIGREVWDQRKK